MSRNDLPWGDRLAMRWEARKARRATVGLITGEAPGSRAAWAVERLSLRRSIIRALRSPLMPAVAGAALLGGLALLLVGVLVGAALTRPTAVPA